MLSSPSTGIGDLKYARLNASDVCDDPLNNHGSEGSPITVERSAAVLSITIVGVAGVMVVRIIIGDGMPIMLTNHSPVVGAI